MAEQSHAHCASCRRGEELASLALSARSVREYRAEAVRRLVAWTGGDGGLIQAVDPVAQTVEVALDDGRLVAYEFADLDELLHAYALSVHRAQGSEYDAVVLALHTQHYVMLQRNLLYTAVSRARRLVVIVGSPRALGLAIKNDRRAVRYSGLAGRLRGLAPEEPRVTLIGDLDELKAYFAS